MQAKLIESFANHMNKTHKFDGLSFTFVNEDSTTNQAEYMLKKMNLHIDIRIILFHSKDLFFFISTLKRKRLLFSLTLYETVD